MEIDVRQLHAMREKKEMIYLLDVRTAAEWQVARIKGATLIPLQELPLQIPHIAEVLGGRKVVVYCHTGRRSRVATAMLREQGIEAYNLAGGINAWSAIDPALPRY